MKAISYSIFGFGKTKDANCFEFDAYMRGLILNVRFNRIIYPSWQTVVNVDGASYSQYRRIFDWLQNKGHIVINLCDEDDPLCLAMLWRMKTVFAYIHPDWIYSHVLCRDVDSICTYREAQAVQQWIDEGKTAHCITDSISHNIPMMGGMIGFKPGDLSFILGVHTWEEFMKLGDGINYKRKGADQDFLNRYIYPKVAKSVTEHFVLGMRHDLAEEDGRHYSIPDYPIDVDPVFKVTNECAGHIGAAGCYDPPTQKFLNRTDPYRGDYGELNRLLINAGIFPSHYFIES